MTVRRTIPPITEQQNTQPLLRLLAAQRRLYADVKGSHNRRLVALLLIAITTTIVGVFAPAARNYVGGIAAIGMGVWAAVGEVVEKRKNGIAASIQEQFDTRLYGLERHEFLEENVSDWDITTAAERGSLDGLPDWYQPRSLSTLVRPLDILVCQQANLGYGIALHRAYARAIVITLSGELLVAVALGLALRYTLLNWIFALFAPLAASAVALVKEAVTHTQSASSKSSAQAKVTALWRRALDNPEAVTDAHCRQAQDSILKFRQMNARVPEWFYRWQRDKNEATMLASATHLVDEARERGRTLPAGGDA